MATSFIEELRPETQPDLVEDTNRKSKRKGHGGDRDDSEWKDQYKAMNTKMLHEKMVQATKYKDKTLLEKSIKGYNDSGQSTSNNDTYEEASKLLDILNTKEALIEATKKKDIDDIHLLLSSITQNDNDLKRKYKENKKPWRKAYGYEDQLLFEMAEARKVVRVLKSGKGKNRKPVPTSLKLERNTMSEIKRYSNPPESLHDVMRATFLLLGIDEEITEDWGTCAKLSNPDGREGLNRRLQAFDSSKLHPEICARAKDILSELEYKKIIKASAGGATFYIWSMGTIDEYEQTQNLDDIDAADIEKQKELLRPEDQHNKDEHPMFIPITNKRKGLKFPDNLRAPEEE